MEPPLTPGRQAELRSLVRRGLYDAGDAAVDDGGGLGAPSGGGGPAGGVGSPAPAVPPERLVGDGGGGGGGGGATPSPAPSPARYHDSPGYPALRRLAPLSDTDAAATAAGDTASLSAPSSPESIPDTLDPSLPATPPRPPARASSSSASSSSVKPLTPIEQYWRERTISGQAASALAAAAAILGPDAVVLPPPPATPISTAARRRAAKQKRRPKSAGVPARRNPASMARSKVADARRLESDVAWRRALDASAGWSEEAAAAAAHHSEGRARARRHHAQSARHAEAMRAEAQAQRRAGRRTRRKRRAADTDALVRKLMPEEHITGGLEGRERKSWKILMKRHAQVVSTPTLRVHSRLDKHVEKRRRALRAKSKARFGNATANDGGMHGARLQWWRQQRALHDKVVSTASVRIDTRHEPHVEEERERLRAQREARHAQFDPADGGLQGPEKAHWRIMTERHDQMIEAAEATVSTRLDEHVLRYRETLERKKQGPTGAREAGLSGRELTNWRLFREVHNKIIDGAEARETTRLAPHAARYRRERRAKSAARFRDYDVSSGGLQGPELKVWNSVRATHDRVVGTAQARVDKALPKHVQAEWDRKRARGQAKWAGFDPDVNGGCEPGSNELAHWKIMHKLHDELVATATPTVETRLAPHVAHYREHLKKKHRERWSEPDNAGLEGRELKWWREQKAIFERLKGSAASALRKEGLMELPKHVRAYREYLAAARARQEATRTPNDGMLTGPQLEHWKIMRGIHDELIATATKCVDVEHEPHVVRHGEYVKARNKARFAPEKGFTAGLDGPELHHWRQMTKLHDEIMSKAESRVDCQRKKTVAEKVMARMLQEKWMGRAWTPDGEKKKRRARRRRERRAARERAARARAGPVGRQLLTEDQYVRALEIAKMVQAGVYDHFGEEDGGGERGAGGGGGGGGASTKQKTKMNPVDREERGKGEVPEGIVEGDEDNGSEEEAVPSWGGIRNLVKGTMADDFLGEIPVFEEERGRQRRAAAAMVDSSDEEENDDNEEEEEEEEEEFEFGHDSLSFTRRRLQDAIRDANRTMESPGPATRRSPISLSSPKGRK